MGAVALTWPRSPGERSPSTLVPLPARPRPDIPARAAGGAASGYRAGAAGPGGGGGAEGLRLRKRREGPGRLSSGLPWGRRGGLPGLISQAPAPPTRSSDRSSAAPACVHAAPQATAFRPRPGDTRPAAQRLAVPLLLPLALQGRRRPGSPRTWVAPGRGALEPAPSRRRRARRCTSTSAPPSPSAPAGAGERAGRPRVGEYPSSTGRAGTAASRVGGDRRMRAPVLKPAGENGVAGVRQPGTVPALPEGPVGAQSPRESGLVPSGIYKAVKNFHRVAPYLGNRYMGKLEEQASGSQAF